MKKFAVVGTTIFLSIILFFISFKMLVGDKVISDDRADRSVGILNFEVKYVGYENTEAGTNIVISIKNNSSSLVDLDDITVDFSKKSNNSFDFNSIIFKAVEKDWYDYYRNQKYLSTGKEYEDKVGIDPGEEVQYIIYIPKGIKFDKDIYDLNNMNVNIDGKTFKFRLSKKSMLGGFTSFGGSKNIINSGEPIVIE